MLRLLQSAQKSPGGCTTMLSMCRNSGILLLD